MSALISLATVK